MRILHLPIDLGGHPSGLARAQRKLGHEVVVGNLPWSPFGFHGDLNYGLPLHSPWRLPGREFGRAALLIKSVLWADVIHAHFGQTLASVRPFPLKAPNRGGVLECLTVRLAKALWLQDINLWRSLGKTVAMSFYGDDLRFVAQSAERNPWSHLAIPEISNSLLERDEIKKNQIEKLSKSKVKLITVNPDIMNVLPEGSLFVPYTHIDIETINMKSPPREGPVKFVHMPSNRLVKGTNFFVEAISELQREGIPCSLTLVEDKEHADAFEFLQSHDVLLDQLRVGWYGAVAVEAMAVGLPVITYIFEEDCAWLPAEMRTELPIIRANPGNVKEIIRHIALMPALQRNKIGISGRKFAERWHDPQRIAQEILFYYNQ